MREIKFRAWDRKKKEWATGGEYHYLALAIESGEIFFVHHSGQVEDTELYPTESIVLMQFTGLHDKHGKEIYEGDIVKLYPSDKSGVQILWDEHIAGFGFGNQAMADHLNFRKLATISYEVVGNIYSNPELLEKK